MNQRGNLIRLIDVVLILLFGFISISELGGKSPIQLPVSTQTPPSPPDPEEVILVSVTAEGRYILEDHGGRQLSPSAVRAFLARSRQRALAEGVDLRVKIRSNWNTPIKYTMYIADLCDELGIAKGVEVQRRGR